MQDPSTTISQHDNALEGSRTSKSGQKSDFLHIFANINFNLTITAEFSGRIVSKPCVRVVAAICCGRKHVQTRQVGREVGLKFQNTKTKSKKTYDNFRNFPYKRSPWLFLRGKPMVEFLRPPRPTRIRSLWVLYRRKKK